MQNEYEKFATINILFLGSVDFHSHSVLLLFQVDQFVQFLNPMKKPDALRITMKSFPNRDDSIEFENSIENVVLAVGFSPKIQREIEQVPLLNNEASERVEDTNVDWTMELETIHFRKSYPLLWNKREIRCLAEEWSFHNVVQPMDDHRIYC